MQNVRFHMARVKIALKARRRVPLGCSPRVRPGIACPHRSHRDGEDEDHVMSSLSRVLVSVVSAGALLVVATPAHAANANADYGQHVRHCTQHMGFSGDHNPGMHQGKSGWDPMHMCPDAI